MADLVLVPAEDVAVILGVSVRTLCDWRYEGRGPDYYAFGGKGPGSRMVRYAMDDVLAWAAAHRVQAAEQKAQPALPPIRRMRKSKKLKVEG